MLYLLLIVSIALSRIRQNFYRRALIHRVRTNTIKLFAMHDPQKSLPFAGKAL